MKYWLANLIAIDQLINTLLWGYPDETLSSRAYRMKDRKKRWKIAHGFINKLFFWEEEHCMNAWLSETRNHHLPPIFQRTE